MDDREWKSECMMSWSETDIQKMLSDAENILLDTAKHLRLPVEVSKLSERAKSLHARTGANLVVLQQVMECAGSWARKLTRLYRRRSDECIEIIAESSVDISAFITVSYLLDHFVDGSTHYGTETKQQPAMPVFF